MTLTKFSSTVAAIAMTLLQSPIASHSAAAQGNFIGPYAGIAVDYGISELNTVKTVTIPPTEEEGSRIGGFAGTVFAGYNHDIGRNMIVGLEGDFTFGRWTGTFHNDDYLVDWNASLRARFGQIIHQDLLAYVTAGVSWMHASVSPNGVGSFDRTFVGYVVGGGFEYAWRPSMYLRLEYLYSNYNSWSFNPTPLINEKVDPDLHQIRLGLVIPLQH
jgi:outer membrane immunogenic protein